VSNEFTYQVRPVDAVTGSLELETYSDQTIPIRLVP
jgi:hypothetical protein